MSNILYPPSRPQSVGEILDLGFRIFSTTLLKCLPYSFLGVIISQLPALYDAARSRSVAQALWVPRLQDPLWWLLLIAAMFATLMLSNAVLLRQYALATGRPATAGTELATGARRVPGVLLIAILLMLAVLATFIPVFILMFRLVGLGSAAPVSVTLVWVTVSTYLLLLICASWAVVRWICAGAIYLLTDRGPVASMSHSWLLTSGSFWRLSMIYTVGVVMIIVLYALSSLIGGVVALLLGHGDLAVITATWVAVASLVGALITPFYSALVLAVYGDVSVRREGVDLAQRISAPATQ